MFGVSAAVFWIVVVILKAPGESSYILDHIVLDEEASSCLVCIQTLPMVLTTFHGRMFTHVSISLNSATTTMRKWTTE